MAGGDPLSVALDTRPPLVDPVTLALVRAGEEAGTLPASLVAAHDLTEAADRRARELRAAATYPAVVLAISTALTVGVLALVVPRFAALFAALDADLPVLTRAILRAADALNGPSGALLLLGALAGAAGLRRRPPPGSLRDRLLDRAPVLGRMRRDLAVSTALSVLAGLLAGGVPLLRALVLASDAATSGVVRVDLERIAAAVREGTGLTAAIAVAASLPPWVAEVLAVAEETGDLTGPVRRAATSLGVRTDERVRRLTSVLEPALIGAAGLLVGVVVLGLYLPMFRVVELVG